MAENKFFIQLVEEGEGCTVFDLFSVDKEFHGEMRELLQSYLECKQLEALEALEPAADGIDPSGGPEDNVSCAACIRLHAAAHDTARRILSVFS